MWLGQTMSGSAAWLPRGGSAQASQPSVLHLLHASNVSRRFGTSCSARSPPYATANVASADFCLSFVDLSASLANAGTHVARVFALTCGACAHRQPGHVSRPARFGRPTGSPPFADRQISRGKTRDFRSIHLSHLRPLVRMTSGFQLPSAFAHPTAASMRFVFLRPELCLQLPLHTPSRQSAQHASVKLE